MAIAKPSAVGKPRVLPLVSPGRAVYKSEEIRAYEHHALFQERYPHPEESMTGIRKQTYGDQITEYIKECILRGEFRAGDKINEADLATRLKVSRAPVREALQHLAQTGLLVSVPQKGKFIASLTAREIQDSYFTGAVLEGAAVASTIHLFTDDDFAGMEKLLNEMASLARTNCEMCTIAELDTAFHEFMFMHSENKLIRTLSRRSCLSISKFLLYRDWCASFTPDEMYDRHKIVLDAVKSRDPRRIEGTIREHYVEAGRRLSKFGSDARPS